MRYLGGKSRIGKEIADVIAPKGPWFEPFCGGLNVTRHLAKHYPFGLATDAHSALITLYLAVRQGWTGPPHVSGTLYEYARTLPDDEPLKGFAGFGCSFGGKYFGGLASGEGRNYADESRRAIVKALRECPDVEIAHEDFMSVSAVSGFEAVYCDPPYAGTTGYAVGPFDHSAFWSRCREWAQTGARVFVSEYVCPVTHSVVWEKMHATTVGRGKARQGQARLERLFRVLP